MNTDFRACFVHGIAIPDGMGIVIPGNKNWWNGIGLPIAMFGKIQE